MRSKERVIRGFRSHRAGAEEVYLGSSHVGDLFESEENFD